MAGLLQDKVVLVAGLGGIGNGLARRFADAAMAALLLSDDGGGFITAQTISVRRRCHVPAVSGYSLWRRR